MLFIEQGIELVRYFSNGVFIKVLYRLTLGGFNKSFIKLYAKRIRRFKRWQIFLKIAFLEIFLNIIFFFNF